jgi:hypothetical protein
VLVRCIADEKFLVHDYIVKPYPVQPVEFIVPTQSTEDGKLVLSFNQSPGGGGNGRGCQISEKFLCQFHGS